MSSKFTTCSPSMEERQSYVIWTQTTLYMRQKPKVFKNTLQKNIQARFDTNG